MSETIVQESNTCLHGRARTRARVRWIVFAATLTLLQILSQVAMLQQLSTSDLAPSQLAALQAMGLSIQTYNFLRFLWEAPLALAWGGLGLLIFLRKSNERSALIISALMVGIGMAGAIPPWQAFATAYPNWVWVVPIAALIGNLCINSFFFVFPTGHFVPRWAVVIAITFSAYNILNSYAFALPPPLVALSKSTEWFFPIFAVTALIAIVGAPIYRYRKVSTAVERQQIKWVVFTIAFAFTMFALTASTVFWAPGGNPDQDISFITVYLQPFGWMASLLLIPLSIAVSILRYRLFDIDIIIRRTVTYSIVVTLLGVVFFGSVILLQQIFAQFTNTGGNEIITVISTLVIAALFVPLRNRIQDVIDKRFNRKKYDAQKVLRKFSETVRDETDIDKLTAELLNVVNETMQPRSVTVWLKRDGGPFGKLRASSTTDSGEMKTGEARR